MSAFISTPERIAERGCTSCTFGSFEMDQEPCMTCDRTSTKKIPYPLWRLDPNYDTNDGETAPSSSGTSPRQQMDLSSQQLAFEAEPFQKTAMTGEEIKAALSDEILRINKVQDKAAEDLRKLPEQREDAIIDVIYELVPAWHQHEEKREEVEIADQRCQSRESTWETANKGWIYQPTIKNPTWKDKARDFIRTADEKAWQTEGTNIKKWREKIERAREKLEREKQRLQDETNAKGSQIHQNADDLMAQREALLNELNLTRAVIQQMRSVYQTIPKGNEPFTISSGCDAMSLISDIDLLTQIEYRKDQEREIEKAKSKEQGITTGRKR